MSLLVEDFEVTETERRTSAAVALCVDLSYSMVADGRWGPMKQTALALQHLIETRFRQDALQVIGFNRLARRLTPVELAEAERAAYMETAAEDDEIAQRMDAGRKALMDRGLSQTGPYQSPMEDGMQHFHEFLRREVGDIGS